MISQPISWHLRGGMAQVGGAGARRSTSSGLAIANVLGTGVQLNGDGLDPAHGLVAAAAARAVHGGRFVVIEKSRLIGCTGLLAESGVPRTQPGEDGSGHGPTTSRSNGPSVTTTPSTPCFASATGAPPLRGSWARWHSPLRRVTARGSQMAAGGSRCRGGAGRVCGPAS
jgi:hypothetical protein